MAILILIVACGRIILKIVKCHIIWPLCSRILVVMPEMLLKMLFVHGTSATAMLFNISVSLVASSITVTHLINSNGAKVVSFQAYFYRNAV